MKDDSDIPLDKDDGFIVTDVASDFRTICGYCTQGNHSQCRGFSCSCDKNNHKSGI